MACLVFYSLKEKRVNIDDLLKSKESIGITYVDLADEVKEVAIFANGNEDFIVIHEDWGLRTVAFEKVRGLWHDYLGVKHLVAVKEVGLIEVHLI